MSNHAELLASYVEICEMQFQAPWWFWLAFILLFIIGIAVFTVRNSLRESVLPLFFSLAFSGFSLNIFNALGTTDCLAAADNPFGPIFLVSGWEWMMALVIQPPGMYLLSLGAVEAVYRLTKNRPNKNLNPHLTRHTTKSNPGDEGNFRRYL